MIFLQQQPAYQMEYAGYDAYDKGTIREIADILGDLFHEVAFNPGIQALALPVPARRLITGERRSVTTLFAVADGDLFAEITQQARVLVWEHGGILDVMFVNA